MQRNPAKNGPNPVPRDSARPAAVGTTDRDEVIRIAGVIRIAVGGYGKVSDYYEAAKEAMNAAHRSRRRFARRAG